MLFNDYLNDEIVQTDEQLENEIIESNKSINLLMRTQKEYQ